jgi:hypothetical protein
MSNKDNWDDSSDDEEDMPTADPVLKEGGLLRFNLDTVNATASEVPMEYDAVEFVENEEEPIETVAEEEYPQEEEWGGEDIDEDYDDDYDDEIDKKLGRYVSCR